MPDPSAIREIKALTAINAHCEALQLRSAY
jgi:hypothetical protein